MDDLVSYRIENAREKLESSKILLDAGHYKDSIGRSYIRNAECNLQLFKKMLKNIRPDKKCGVEVMCIGDRLPAGILCSDYYIVCWQAFLLLHTGTTDRKTKQYEIIHKTKHFVHIHRKESIV